MMFRKKPTDVKLREPKSRARNPVTRLSAPVAHLVGPGFVRVINENLAFAAKQNSGLRLDPRTIRLIYCYGSVSWSDAALQLVMKSGTQVAMLSSMAANCFGTIVPAATDGVRLRSLQHQVLAQESHVLEIARQVVLDKLDSQRATVRHMQRHGNRLNRGWSKELNRIESKTKTASALNVLRGHEGAATATWFKHFGSLLPKPLQFPGRRRRPPTDPINALISLSSMLLLRRAVALLHARGLEVNLGTLHQYKPGRPSLACDAIESLRADAVERWVLQLCNRRCIKPNDFVVDAKTGGVRLTPAHFLNVLENWESNWFGFQLDERLVKWTEWFEKEIRIRAGGNAWQAGRTRS